MHTTRFSLILQQLQQLQQLQLQQDERSVVQLLHSAGHGCGTLAVATLQPL